MEKKSFWVAEIDETKCKKCGGCKGTCEIKALTCPKGKVPKINLNKCCGCGTCAEACGHGAIRIKKR